MKSRFSRLIPVCVATAFTAGFYLSPHLSAQQGGGAGARGGGAAPAPAGQRAGGRGPAAPAGPAPRLANGKPDLTGLWANPYTANMTGRGGAGVLDPKTRQPLTFARKGERFAGDPKDGQGNDKTFDLPYTEWGLNQWRKYDPVGNGDYAGNCLPFGMSRNINSPHGVQIVHHPDALAFLFEQNTWHHWVPLTAGFKWPADLPPTWNGSSTGRWEGDTLIVETKGFNGYTKLDTAGHPHSKDLVLINTFTRTDANTIEHTVLVRDPKAYTQEWMNVRTWRTKAAGDVLMEYSCDENNLQGILDGAIKFWKAPEDLDD